MKVNAEDDGQQARQRAIKPDEGWAWIIVLAVTLVYVSVYEIASRGIELTLCNVHLTV